MADRVWYSRISLWTPAHRPVSQTKPGDQPLAQQTEYVLDPSKLPWMRIRRGETLAPDQLASRFYICDPVFDTKRDHTAPRFPKAFANGYVFVNDEITKVMREFDLAPHALHKVSLFEHDAITPIHLMIHLLNFGFEQPTIDVEHTAVRQRSKKTPELFSMPIDLKRNKVSCLPSALLGPDLWVDKRFPLAFFVSDALGTALQKAGLSNAMVLSPLSVA